MFGKFSLLSLELHVERLHTTTVIVTHTGGCQVSLRSLVLGGIGDNTQYTTEYVSSSPAPH